MFLSPSWTPMDTEQVQYVRVSVSVSEYVSVNMSEHVSVNVSEYNRVRV